MSQTLRVRPDPLVVKRHNDLFDLWTAFALEHVDDPDYDPDDDPDFVTQARHIMGLAPFGSNAGEITKRRSDIDMDPDFHRFRHWWIPLTETLLFEHTGTLPSGRQLHTITRQDGRTYLRIGGDDLTIHLEDTGDLADAIDDQLDLDPGDRDDLTILTTTGDLELGPRPEGGLLLRRVDTSPGVPFDERTVMVWALPDDDAATVSDMLNHLATLDRAEPTSLRQVNDHLGFTLLSDGRIAPILGRSGSPEPVALDPAEATALADMLSELRRRKLKVTTGTGARGIGAMLGGRKKAEHTEIAQVAAGRIRVGWWSDGLVTVELANPDGGVVEVQLAAKDVSDAMKILRELASRAGGGGVRKGRLVQLGKRVRDADHNPNYHRFRHGWIPLGGIADLLAADIPDDREVPLADLPAADTLAHRAFDHTANGITARVDPEQSQVYRHPEHGLVIQVGGPITDADGQIVGSFRRYLYPESRTIHDDSFALAEEHQRRGFYRGFTAQSDRTLAAAGFERVTSSPSAVGGYARAAAGDTWDSTARRAPYGDVPTRIIDTLIRGEVSEADRATLMGWLDAFQGDREGWPSPQEIARHGEIGRAVMVGAAWQSEHWLVPDPPSRSDALLGKWLAATLTKRRRDIDGSPDIHRYRHGWIPLVTLAQRVIMQAIGRGEIHQYPWPNGKHRHLQADPDGKSRNVTAMVDRLIDDGLVERRPPTEGRRGFSLHLTDQGLEAVKPPPPRTPPTRIRRVLAAATDIPSVNKAIATEARRITGRDIHIDMTGSDLDIAREHGEGILRGLERFPDAALVAVDMDDLSADAASTGAHKVIPIVVTRPRNGGYAISLDRSQAADPTELLADLQQGNTGHAKFRTAPTPMGNILHEFGHVVANQHGLNEDIDRVSGDIAAAAGAGSISGYVITHVSRRAGTNMRELAAEIFADMLANEDQASEMSRRVYAITFRRHEGNHELSDADLTKAAHDLIDTLILLGKAAGYAGRGTPAGTYRARHLHRYWVSGKGVTLWADSPRPWTTLYHHLLRYIKNPDKAKRTAAKWFHEVMGFWPGSDINRVLHGGKPRGKRIGPG